MEQELNNLELVRLLHDSASGNRVAFQRLYDATAPRLYAVALKLLRDRAAADDVLQDAYVQIWHRAGDYHDQRGSPLAWLTTIVRYRAIDALRKARSRAPLEESTIDSAMDSLGACAPAGDGPMQRAVLEEDADYLIRCLSRLSESQRQGVALAFYHGLTHSELAQSLAVPLGTIKSRLRRSLLRLRDCLKELGVGS